jgi:hypothetical protein
MSAEVIDPFPALIVVDAAEIDHIPELIDHIPELIDHIPELIDHIPELIDHLRTLTSGD